MHAQIRIFIPSYGRKYEFNLPDRFMAIYLVLVQSHLMHILTFTRGARSFSDRGVHNSELHSKVYEAFYWTFTHVYLICLEKQRRINCRREALSKNEIILHFILKSCIGYYILYEHEYMPFWSPTNYNRSTILDLFTFVVNKDAN